MTYPDLGWESAQGLRARIAESLSRKRGFSLVRLGDGESLMLAHNLVISTADAMRRGPFLSYAGVRLPDLRGRDRVASAVRQADVVGITPSLKVNYFTLLWPALTAHGIDIAQLDVATATVNYDLHSGGFVGQILLQSQPMPRVLLVGNLAEQLAAAMTDQGADVAGVVPRVDGVADVDRVMGEMARHEYDIALISAGVAAVVIASETARKTGHVAIDFGHLADEIAHGVKRLVPPPHPA